MSAGLCWIGKRRRQDWTGDIGGIRRDVAIKGVVMGADRHRQVRDGRKIGTRFAQDTCGTGAVRERDRSWMGMGWVAG